MAPRASGGGDRQDGGPDFSDEKKRLDALRGKLDKVAHKGDGAAPEMSEADRAKRGRAMGIAFRIATDLVAGVAVGGFMGWFLDRWLGTAPILLIVFLLLGIAAGLLNSVRAAQRLQKDL
jgi:ATP synthase protein I